MNERRVNLVQLLEKRQAVTVLFVNGSIFIFREELEFIYFSKGDNVFSQTSIKKWNQRSMFNNSVCPSYSTQGACRLKK